jgi:hypothetical protein
MSIVQSSLRLDFVWGKEYFDIFVHLEPYGKLYPVIIKLIHIISNWTQTVYELQGKRYKFRWASSFYITCKFTYIWDYSGKLVC